MNCDGVLSGDAKLYVSLTSVFFFRNTGLAKTLDDLSIHPPGHWADEAFRWRRRNDELIFSNCDTNEVGSFGIQLPITMRPPGIVTRPFSGHIEARV